MGESLISEMLPAFADSTSSWVGAYESQFANLVGSKRAIAFGYGRHALMSILSAAGLHAGDGIILSPLTCKVVPLALLSLKLKPVYADISANTLNLDPERVKCASGMTARAVLFQHTYGNMGGVEAVAKLAAQKGLLMFEDCAQCLPYPARDRSPGNWGQAAFFSNNLLKPLPAGSGGVAVTNDHGLARKIQEMRDRLPRPSKLSDLMLRMEILTDKYVLWPALYWELLNLYRHMSPSYRVQPVDEEITREITSKAKRVSAYQMSEGARSLRHLGAAAQHRQLCCEEYTRFLYDSKHLKLPCEPLQPLYYFPVLVENKDELLRKARRKQIELIAWPIRTPIYPIENERNLPAYGYEPGACPVAENVAATLIGLPTHSKITAGHRRRIVNLLINHNN
jgi:dTDP-4-amino-4,6-dideoxygalactose transaminase